VRSTEGLTTTSIASANQQPATHDKKMVKDISRDAESVGNTNLS
jgi:hypothetical protein